MKLILGLTGSVATILNAKLFRELSTIGKVETILTERAGHFVTMEDNVYNFAKVYTDKDEWDYSNRFNPTFNSKAQWSKNDKVLHVELRNNSSALVIAPCSANTLAKLANGITDNLLTSVARAWDLNRPIIIVPAMNTHMWNHPVTQEHIDKLKKWGYKIVEPQLKMLACNTEGMGAMANICEIVKTLKNALQWQPPLDSYSGIPMSGHPGAFLTQRKYHTHTGVDLYCNDGQLVHAVEGGTVVGIEDFTGASQQTPWWNDTRCILIEGASGVICYGEMEPNNFEIGKKIISGQYLGQVKRVLKEGKERFDIDGHSTSMLHLEIYKHGVYRAFEEVGDNKSDWNDLIDPTPFLLSAVNAPTRMLKA